MTETGIELYDRVSALCSRTITHRYSTSFSLATRLLSRPMREAIYAVYGFVRVADEIVDTFSDCDQGALIEEFKRDTFQAIERGVSTNPVLHAFQWCVRTYRVEAELIEAFFASMEADLQTRYHGRESYDRYVYGSAEVVGLMCLRIFAKGDERFYRDQYSAARALGSAFQKVNFLRDLRFDTAHLGRSYFPGVSHGALTEDQKLEIERELDGEFDQALTGIKALPMRARFGVYLAFVYYRRLFEKLRALSAQEVLAKRVRVSDIEKMMLLFRSCFRVWRGAL